jgi:tRNA A37 threonylcarbamoyladenosine dehydratase
MNDSFDGSLNCHGFGSSVTVTSTFGMCAAGEVIRTLAKITKPAL